MVSCAFSGCVTSVSRGPEAGRHFFSSFLASVQVSTTTLQKTLEAFSFRNRHERLQQQQQNWQPGVLSRFLLS